MKKFILLVLFFLCFSYTEKFNNISISKIINSKLEYITDEIWIEYVYINNQWYQITHFDDGTIGIVPVECPPKD